MATLVPLSEPRPSASARFAIALQNPSDSSKKCPFGLFVGKMCVRKWQPNADDLSHLSARPKQVGASRWTTTFAIARVRPGRGRLPHHKSRIGGSHGAGSIKRKFG